MDTHSSPAATSAKPLAPPAMPPVEPREVARLTLPSWCQNETGRALIAQILSHPPETRVRASSDDYACYGIEYEGVPAARLRRLFDRESARLLAIADAEYAAGKPWAEAVKSWTSFMHGERADALIERVLADCCDWCREPFGSAGIFYRETLDGDRLCQGCCDKWARGDA